MKTFRSFYIWLIAFLGSILCGIVLVILNPLFYFSVLFSAILFCILVLATLASYFSDRRVFLLSLVLGLLDLWWMSALFSQDVLMFVNVWLSWLLGLLGFSCLVCWAVTEDMYEHDTVWGFDPPTEA